MVKFDIITIFPNIFTSYFGESILKRAQSKNLIEINAHDLRQWAIDRHKTVDDSPYGGGPGMVMKVEPIFKAVSALKSLKFKVKSSKLKKRVILFSAKGKQFTQADARRLAKYDQLILICGRYEGVDERVAQHIADEELSVGNFVLTGGEIPAMIVVDVVSRLIPGVLGKKESLKEESFSIRKQKTENRKQYLEYPQYTRPEKFKGWKVPEVLLSGNHKKIEEWREKASRIRNQES
ncbi:tRNA (guanosine(37)-N1)-methyltransferase TrmD [Patescibacteria group bacterium]|nr:tRNA (guanosine(37)-N1)-methyltransferase TrmD [Patescibacteria group bacterium]